jgi:hypothetical protein
LAPDKVKVPVPVLVKPPVPLIEPLKVVEVFRPPTVNVPLPRRTLPTPERSPRLSTWLFKSRIGGVPKGWSIVTADAAGITLSASARSVVPL